ncbi:MAG: DUF2752 domain-containing protein [Candidatus Woesearchaeota archaeon]
MGADINSALAFFLDCIGFNSPRAIVFNILAVFLLLALIPTSWLAHSPMQCVFRTVILPFVFGGDCPDEGFFAGCNCPGCGLTRGMSRLMHADISGALQYNPLVPAVFVVMSWLLLDNLRKILQA